MTSQNPIVLLAIAFLICEVYIEHAKAASFFDWFIEPIISNSANTNETDTERYAKLTPPELIKEYGYLSETHNVITDDGYILKVHRIPNPGKQPVLLMHGVLDSSASWVMLGQKYGLGFLLHNLGYDVWMLNARGNDYSVGHIKYDRNGPGEERRKYWDFSWHEIGIFDLPKTIDFILKNTDHSRLHYIGHSQGTTTFFVMMSERPEYSKKVSFMTAMAPAIFMGHNNNELVKVSCSFLNSIETIADLIGYYQFDKKMNKMLRSMQNSISCDQSILQNTQLCNHNLSPFVGNATAHLNKNTMPILSAHAPAGASLKQLYHFGQLIKSDRFCQYDYGKVQNLDIYNRETPPDYSLNNCSTKIAIIYSNADALVPTEDVLRLSKQLPNLVAIHRVTDNTFAHMDFMWAQDAKQLVYNHIFDWLKSEEKR